MKRKIAMIQAGVITMMLTALVWADSTLPFNVNLGGQKAILKDQSAPFASVAEAVAPDAKLVLEVDPQMIIINIYPCNEKGEVDNTAAASIIMIQDGKETSLDQTMDKKKLGAGNYVMNIVAGGKTARVMFKVK